MTIQSESEYQHGFLIKCKEAYELVQGFLKNTLPWGSTPARRTGYPFDPEVRERVKVKIEETMQQLGCSIENHGLEEIAISYNGGKDCLVMLVLLLATIHLKFVGTKLPPNYKLDSIYINSEIQFPSLTEFIEESTISYHLNPVNIRSSLKEGFEKYLSTINPKIKAIVVGVRSSDPYSSKLQFEQYTDHNWPRFLRIHPMLHWNYTDVWDFLVGCNLDYCEMYDVGFTSLGGVHNTVPNPYLKVDDAEYLPAYMMREHADERERLGRLK